MNRQLLYYEHAHSTLYLKHYCPKPSRTFTNKKYLKQHIKTADGKFTLFILLIAVVNPKSCLSLSSSSFLCCSLEAANAFANSWSSSSSCQLSGWSMTHVSPWKALCSRFFLASPRAGFLRAELVPGRANFRPCESIGLVWYFCVWNLV